MLLVSRSMGYSFLQSINQVLLVQLGGVLHLAGDPSGEARLSKLCWFKSAQTSVATKFDKIMRKSVETMTNSPSNLDILPPI